MYKIKFRLVPKQFTELFTKIEDIHSYHTRQRSSIEYAIPRTRLKIAQKSFTYTGIGITRIKLAVVKLAVVKLAVVKLAVTSPSCHFRDLRKNRQHKNEQIS